MAATVASIRRKQRQEELREKLQGAQYLTQLEEIDTKLQAGAVTKDELDVLKARIALNQWRLDKLLPTEKFIEVDADVKGDMSVRSVNVRGVGPRDNDA